MTARQQSQPHIIFMFTSNTRTSVKVSYKNVIVNLYVQLIQSDGSVKETEISLGKKMIELEKINPADFYARMEAMKQSDSETLYEQSLKDLRLLSLDEQLRCIAWLCILANSDGFMDRKEWQFIYRIYHKALGLPLMKIMEIQKEILKDIGVVQTNNFSPPM